MISNRERESVVRSSSAAAQPALRALRVFGTAILWAVLGMFILWATAAIYFDFRIDWLRIPLTLIYISGIIAILIRFWGSRWAAILCLVSGFCVLQWWLTLKPSNDGEWQPDNARTAWAEIDGDRVIIHNLRNCDYRTETDYSNCWTERRSIFHNSGRGLLPDELGDKLCEPPNREFSIWGQ